MTIPEVASMQPERVPVFRYFLPYFQVSTMHFFFSTVVVCLLETGGENWHVKSVILNLLFYTTLTLFSAH